MALVYGSVVSIMVRRWRRGVLTSDGAGAPLPPVSVSVDTACGGGRRGVHVSSGINKKPLWFVAQPLTSRTYPMVTLPCGSFGDEAYLRELKALADLYPSGTGAKTGHGLQRAAWRGLEHQARMEAEKLRGLGEHQKATYWMEQLERALEKRKERARQRKVAFLKNRMNPL